MCVGITRPKYVDTNAGARAFRITRIKPTPQTRCNRLTDLAGGGRGFRLEAFARPHRPHYTHMCNGFGNRIGETHCYSGSIFLCVCLSICGCV